MSSTPRSVNSSSSRKKRPNPENCTVSTNKRSRRTSSNPSVKRDRELESLDSQKRRRSHTEEDTEILSSNNSSSSHDADNSITTPARATNTQYNLRSQKNLSISNAPQSDRSDLHGSSSNNSSTQPINSNGPIIEPSITEEVVTIGKEGVVTIGFRVQNITNICIEKSTFDADVLFFISWQDLSLADPDLPDFDLGTDEAKQRFHKELAQNQPDLKKVWMPLIHCQNLLETRETKYMCGPEDKDETCKNEDAIDMNVRFGGRGYRQRLFLTDRKLGTLVLENRLMGTFDTHYQLHNFPFDEQTLRISLSEMEHIGSLTLSKAEEWKGNNTISYNAQKSLPDWFVHYPSEFVNNKDRTFTASAKRTYMLKLNIRRRYFYYLVNVMLPFSFITILSLTSFAINADEIANRLQVIISLFLTAVAFKFTAAPGLPAVGYLTFLDKVMLIGFTLTVLLAAYISIIPLFFKQVADLRNWDQKVGLPLFVLLIVSMHLERGIRAFLIIRKTNKKMAFIDNKWEGQQWPVEQSQDFSDEPQQESTIGSFNWLF